MAEEGLNPTLIANAIGGGDPTDIRKKLIYAMLQGSTDTSPTNIPGGLNRIAQALLGNLQLRDLERAEGAGAERRSRLWLPGEDGAPPAANAPTVAPQRSASLPPAPTVVPTEPPPNPPGTFPTPKNLTSLTSMTPVEPTPAERTAFHDTPQAQAMAATPLDSQRPPELGGARAQLVAGMEQGLGQGQPNSIVGPQSAPQTLAQAFGGPQQPAGAIPAPMPPGQPPATNQPPPTLPAPREQSGARTSLTIPPEKLPILRQLLESPNRKDREEAKEYLKLYGGPDEWIKLDDNTLFSKKTARLMHVGADHRPLVNPEERRMFGIPDDDKRPYQLDTRSNKLVNPPPETRVNLSTVANPIMEGIGKQFVDSRQKASGASTIVSQIHDARQALDEGAITGIGADIRVGMQKVGALFGLSADQAVNSETFRTSVGNQVLANIKQLGANPSNVDREYIADIMGGRIQLEEKTLRRILEIQEKYARQSIGDFNRDAAAIMKENPDAYRGVAPLMRIEAPPMYSFRPPQRGQAPPAAGAAPGGRTNTGVRWSID